MNKKRGGIRIGFIILLIIAVAIVGLSGYISVSAAIEGRSGISKFYECALDAFMNGDRPVSEEKTLKKVERRRKANAEYVVSGTYKTLYNFTTERVEGNEVCYYEGQDNKAIIYFHGGSYMWQPLITHFDYCNYLRKELGLSVIMPIYPKAPQFNYKDCMEWLSAFYSIVSEEYEIVAFMGDSAGGGLVFTFAQYLEDKGIDSPDDLIAFSPCLDLSLNNAEIADFTKADVMLNWQDLKLKFTFYADGDFESPYVSPIYCDWNKLGEVTTFIGTNEILLPDNRLLNKILTDENIEHNYYEFNNQFHTFAIMPMPERKDCLEKIREALEN